MPAKPERGMCPRYLERRSTGAVAPFWLTPLLSAIASGIFGLAAAGFAGMRNDMAGLETRLRAVETQLARIQGSAPTVQLVPVK